MQLKLQEWQKWLAAGNSALVLISLIMGTIQWITNPVFRNYLQNVPKKGPITAFVENESDLRTKQALKNLDDRLNQINDEQSLYQTINLADLPIYPDSWVVRNFSPDEKVNKLISGEMADPDSDGLSNKEEYFLGSDPKKADSLCKTNDSKPPAKNSKIVCDGSGNDKKYFEMGISPLTGLELETPQTFRLLKQDVAIIGGIKNSFETASSEGVEFPVLYQLSKNIDLTAELNQIAVREVSDIAQNILDYRSLRLEIIKDTVGQSQTSSLSQVYQTIKIDQLEVLKSQYQKQLDQLNRSAVPTKMLITHRSYVLIIRKLINLIDHRMTGIKDGKTKEAEFGKISQEKAVEIVWGYRILTEMGAKDEENL